MGLAFYKEPGTPYGPDVLYSFHNGRTGTVHETILYIRNDDPALYFTELELEIVFSSYIDDGEYAETGWSYKLAYGTRQPTELEWAAIHSGVPLVLSNIGDSVVADTSSYYPVWVRIACPGQQPPQRRSNASLSLTFTSNVVVGP